MNRRKKAMNNLTITYTDRYINGDLPTKTAAGKLKINFLRLKR